MPAARADEAENKLPGKGNGLWQDSGRCWPLAVLAGEELIARLGGMAWPGGTRACFRNVSPAQVCGRGGESLVGEH